MVIHHNYELMMNLGTREDQSPCIFANCEDDACQLLRELVGPARPKGEWRRVTPGSFLGDDYAPDSAWCSQPDRRWGRYGHRWRSEKRANL